MQNKQNQQEEEEEYSLTLKGFLMFYLPEKQAHLVSDGLELYLRRNSLGIAIDNNTMRFVKLRKADC